MENLNIVVAVYDTATHAQEGIRALQKSGFDMRKLSAAGKGDPTEQAIGFYDSADRGDRSLRLWGARGEIWSALCSTLLGSALFFVPGHGHVMVLGPLVRWIVGAPSEAAGSEGLSALGAGLYSVGVPKDSVLKYEAVLKEDHVVVVAEGMRRDVLAAKEILEKSSPLSVAEHLPVVG